VIDEMVSASSFRYYIIIATSRPVVSFRVWPIIDFTFAILFVDSVFDPINQQYLF
jgi:hypothetical protein